MKAIWIEGKGTESAFSMIKFLKTYHLENAQKAVINICADSRYMLYVNGEFIGRGPVSPGADFLTENSKYRYYSTYEVTLDKNDIEISAIVTGKATALSDLPNTSPFLFVDGEIFSKTEKVKIFTDETWTAIPLKERIEPFKTDYRLKTEEKGKCIFVEPTHEIKKTPIENLVEEKILPTNFTPLVVKSGETVEKTFDFDKIYSAYPVLSVKSQGNTKIIFESSEIDSVGIVIDEIYLDTDIIFTSPRMRSVGQVKIIIENSSQNDVIIDDVSIISTMYPVKNETKFECSNELLNRIYNVCMHTLKICRQSLHLDSPTHQELLACTGDYYIQALMEYMNIYDPTLTRFDIYRTAKILEIQDGVLFHTSYSLIYPEWIYDYYMHTGDKTIFNDTKKSLELLMKKFDTYMGKNGLLEYAPNYMFVDWIMINDSDDMFSNGENMMSHGKLDGYSMHHPPKALGQSVLCMFYYNALLKIAKIYDLSNDFENAKKCYEKAEKLKTAINTYLYDKEKGLYIGGLDTEDMVENSEWLPKNTKRKFYLKQANVLSALYGICDEECRKNILEYVVKDLKKVEMQPYFYHFLLEALYKNDMFEKYGISLIEKYESLLNKCEKGLCEAWEGVNGDCSHAWGGTPAYILKKAISGFEMIEPNYKKIKLNLNSYNLEKVDFEIPTPYGNIEIKIDKEKKSIKAPKEIEII